MSNECDECDGNGFIFDKQSNMMGASGHMDCPKCSQPQPDSTECREAFEAQVGDGVYLRTMPDCNRYWSNRTQALWEGWHSCWNHPAPSSSLIAELEAAKFCNPETSDNNAMHNFALDKAIYIARKHTAAQPSSSQAETVAEARCEKLLEIGDILLSSELSDSGMMKALESIGSRKPEPTQPSVEVVERVKQALTRCYYHEDNVDVFDAEAMAIAALQAAKGG
jgi:hypothetical protein